MDAGKGTGVILVQIGRYAQALQVLEARRHYPLPAGLVGRQRPALADQGSQARAAEGDSRGHARRAAADHQHIDRVLNSCPCSPIGNQADAVRRSSVYERGGRMILHLGPLAWPSFLSSVTSGQSSASASATYQAS